MASEADIAIVIPAFNSAATVLETLESIQRQTAGLDRVQYVLLADDASRDDTSAIARSCWTSPVPLVTSRNAANQGERRTVNAAVETLPANVAWFFILHADDVAKPDWLGVMLRTIDRAPALTAAVTASYDVLFPDGRVQTGESLGEGKNVVVAGTPESVRDTLNRGCWFKISSCALRVSSFRTLGGFLPDMPQLGDWDYSLRLLREGFNIEYIPLCLSVYRQGEQSVSSQSFREHRDVKEGIIVLNHFREFLPKRDRLIRYGWYLYILSRRFLASILRRDSQRLKAAARLSFQVSSALCRSLF